MYCFEELSKTFPVQSRVCLRSAALRFYVKHINRFVALHTCKCIPGILPVYYKTSTDENKKMMDV